MKKPNSKSEDGKKFVKIGTEINEMESKRTTQKINETEFVCETISKIGKSLAKLTKRKRDKTHLII
jgi:hypothetical protein